MIAAGEVFSAATTRYGGVWDSWSSNYNQHALTQRKRRGVVDNRHNEMDLLEDFVKNFEDKTYFRSRMVFPHVDSPYLFIAARMAYTQEQVKIQKGPLITPNFQIDTTYQTVKTGLFNNVYLTSVSTKSTLLNGKFVTMYTFWTDTVETAAYFRCFFVIMTDHGLPGAEEYFGGCRRRLSVVTALAVDSCQTHSLPSLASSPPHTQLEWIFQLHCLTVLSLPSTI